MENIQDIRQKQLKTFCIITIIIFLAAAVCLDGPGKIYEGMKSIIISRDALITDYFKLAGYGAAFLNSALMMSFVMLLVHLARLPFTGITMAAFFINAGFALFGKNPVNILSIVFGAFLYARLQRVSFSRYVYTALFGGCLAPLVTEMVYLMPFKTGINIWLALAIGILIGFMLPPLSMHTASMHMGYNLFNVGFAAGILGFVIVCILKGFGFESEAVMIWQEGRPFWLIVLLYGYFLFTFLVGLWLTGKKIRPLARIFKHPGRAVADFILMDGVGSTMMNMALTAGCCLTYILLIGGDLSGPVVGGILTVFGFSAFGVHLKNYLPCLAGVYFSSCLKVYDPGMPAIQLAAMFCSGLAPVAGQFGVVAGITAGVLHTSIVMVTGGMYSGLNLYNNGFAAGFVAIIMVPLIESFMTKFKRRSSKR